MGNSNAKKNATLGMSHSTATNRLRKMVLFRQLNKCGDNICIRCGLVIETVNELSIEHIKPWEGRSSDLFWDLDNVAFSHVSCNKPHSYDRESQKKIGPQGTVWCRAHKDFLPIQNFWKHSGNWNGFSNTCIECMKKKDTRISHVRKGL